jgi:hypothetical protein
VKRIVSQFVFQFQNAFASAQARLQLFGVAGLGQIVVGTRFEATNDVLLGIPGAEQNKVDVGMLGMPADFTANAETFINRLSASVGDVHSRANSTPASRILCFTACYSFSRRDACLPA